MAKLPHILVATPCYGGAVSLRYMHGVIALLMYGLQHGFIVSIETLSYESLITRGRNTLVSKFLDKAEATHLLFIDADIGFEPRQVARMLAFGEDVVAGMYPLKTLAWDEAAVDRARHGESVDSAPIRFVGKPCEGEALETREGFLTGSYAGTGFMMIRREALLRLIEAYPETRYTAAHTTADAAQSPNQYALFDCIIDKASGHYLSEDYTFCQRWRAIGGRVWLDPQGVLAHVGSHDFVGCAAGRLAERRLQASPQT
jgi:hypothetical protein